MRKSLFTKLVKSLASFKADLIESVIGNRKHRTKWVLLIPSVLIIVLRFCGWLQPLELYAYDVYSQLQSFVFPVERLDPRIVIIGIDELDREKFGTGDASLTDEHLAKLLDKLKLQNPVAIGLDLYRNLPVDNYNSQLARVFRTTSNLIGIKKVSGAEQEKVPPPSLLEQLGQVASVDVIVDIDGIVRRAILYSQPDSNTNITTLGYELALRYLKEKEGKEKKGIVPIDDGFGNLMLENAVFKPVEQYDGSYVRTDTADYQVLLNYRSPPAFIQIPVRDFLSEQFSSNPKKPKIENSVVLIGSVEESKKDFFLTPYSRNFTTSPTHIFGVELQASIASYILSSTLEGRPQIRVLGEYFELLWISIVTIVMLCLSYKYYKTVSVKLFLREYLNKLLPIIIGITFFVLLFSFALFCVAWWIPVVPCLLSLWITTVGGFFYYFIAQLLSVDNRLQEYIVKCRETEVELKAERLKIKDLDEELNGKVVYLQELKEELVLKNEEYSQLIENSNLQFCQRLQFSKKIQILLKETKSADWEYDLENKQITLLNNYSSLFGSQSTPSCWSLQEFTNQIYQEDVASFLKTINSCISNQTNFTIDLRIGASTLQPTWARISAQYYSTTESGKVKVAGVITTLVDDYKRMHHEYLKYFNLYSAVAHNVTDAIAILDSQDQIVYTNVAFKNLVRADDNPNRNIEKQYIELVHPQEMNMVKEFLSTTRQHRILEPPVEYRIQDLSGKYRSVRSYGLSKRADDGSIGVIIFSRDTSGQKQFNGALTQLVDASNLLLTSWFKSLY